MYSGRLFDFYMDINLRLYAGIIAKRCRECTPGIAKVAERQMRCPRKLNERSNPIREEAEVPA